MGYSLGWNNPLILTIDPNFQQDIQVYSGWNQCPRDLLPGKVTLNGSEKRKGIPEPQNGLLNSG